MTDPWLTDVWRLVRGDAESAELEHWIYAHSDELEARLGKDVALELLASDFRVPSAVARVRQVLRDYAERTSVFDCRCITLPNIAVVDMGEESERVFAAIERRGSRGAPFWWLWCGECTQCGQWWLIGQEERQNDVFCLRRLTTDEAMALVKEQVWPPAFDTYEALLRLGLEAGKRVTFIDPEQGKCLRWTIEDLAKARPGIRVSELVELLNLDVDVARRLAARAIRADGVVIAFDC